MVRSFNTFFILLAVTALISAAIPAAATASTLEQGVVQFNQANFEEALPLLTEAVRQSPKNARAFTYLGLTQREMGDWPAALAAFRRARTLAPQDGEVVFRLAEALYHNGVFAEALTTVERALERPISRRADLLYLKGRILLKLRRASEAVAAFRQAQAADATLTPAVAYQTGVAYLEEGRYGKAKRIFQGLTTTNPRSDWAIFAQDYLRALEKRPPAFHLQLLTQLGYDDNVLAVPFDQTKAGIDRKKDWKVRLFLLGEYTFNAGRPFTLKASYSLDHTHFAHNSYATPSGGSLFSQDTLIHTFSLMPSYNTARSISSLQLSYTLQEVDYTTYEEVFTAAPSLTFQFAPRQIGQISFAYSHHNESGSYFEKKFGAPLLPAENRDADNYVLGLAYFHPYARGQGLLTLAAEAEQNQAQGSNWDYRGVRLSAGLLQPLGHGFKGHLFLELYRQGFRHTHTLYGKRRDDTTYTLQAALTRKIWNGVKLGLDYRYLRDLSNIVVFSYDRNIYSVTLEYSF